MATKRKINSAKEFNPFKCWKENPPGPEQKELNLLFENNLIKETDTPNAVRNMYPMFQGFSSQVFGVHFRKTKAKFGLMASTGDITEDTSSTIPELGITPLALASDTEKNVKSKNKNFDDTLDDTHDDFSHSPIGKWMYTDHEQQCTFVYVAIIPLYGSTDVNFNLSEDGMEVAINYNWSKLAYHPQRLFHDEIKSGKITHNHPKVQAMANYWLARGITEKSKPSGNIIVKLPIRVQREVGTWKKKVVKESDSDKIILLEFKGFQQNQIIEEADTSIPLD